MFQKHKELEQIADHYGLPAQKIMLMEECGELVQAISKTIRRPEDKEAWRSLKEEMADVMIVLEECIYLMDAEYEVHHMGLTKIQRTLERMDSERIRKPFKAI